MRIKDELGTWVFVLQVGVGERLVSHARHTAGGYSSVVDLYDRGTGQWSTARLSQGRTLGIATSVGTVAIFAGGFGKLLRIVFACC